MSLITEKLSAIQQELKAPKGQFNNFGKYKYRSCEDILEALKPLLGKHGCSLKLTDELVNIGDRYYIKANAVLQHKEEAEVASGYAREEENKKGMDGSQITGTSSSYARKYALNGLFLIDDSKDSDHTNTGKEEPEEKETPSPAPQDDKLTTSVNQCENVGGLNALWDSNPDMHNNKEFIKIVSQRKKQLLTK